MEICDAADLSDWRRGGGRGLLILGALMVAPIILFVACGGQEEGLTATPAASGESTTEETASAGGGAGSTVDDSDAAAPTAEAGNETSSITVTDIRGREVAVEAPVERMILGEGRQLYIVGMLEPDDPFNRVVGWRDDLIQNDPDTYEKYKAKFPEAADITMFGDPGSGEFSVEKAISLEPDVLVLNLDAYQGAQEAGVIEELESAGIPTVVIDFRQHPLENTAPSTLLMGKLMGKRETAQEFVDYYRQQLDVVYSRVEDLDGEKPDVFLYRAAGYGDCCATFGRANLGLLLERAGGINIGSELIPGWSGTLNPEEVVDSDPDIIIVTGANWENADLAAGSYVSLGYLATVDEAREQLQGIIENQSWDMLQSARNGRVHAIWHQFYNSPYNFIALQQFAKWLYPEQFEDLDPEANFEEFHERFLPIDYSGAFWVSLGDSSADSGRDAAGIRGANARHDGLTPRSSHACLTRG